ncbi:MAG: hypothetical protein ACRD3S_15935 [Terracidiphilus sp.]
MMSYVGELRQSSPRDAFDFSTLDRTVLSPVVPSIYDSFEVEKKEGHVIVKMKHRSGEVSFTELDPSAGAFALIELRQRGLVM